MFTKNKQNTCKHCNVGQGGLRFHAARFDCKKIATIVSGDSLLPVLFFSWVLSIDEAAKPLCLIAIFSGGYFVFLGAIMDITLKQMIADKYNITVDCQL